MEKIALYPDCYSKTVVVVSTFTLVNVLQDDATCDFTILFLVLHTLEMRNLTFWSKQLLYISRPGNK